MCCVTKSLPLNKNNGISEVETMKPTSDTETSRSTTPSEKPPTEPNVPTVEEVETIATTTSQEPTEEVITIKPSPTTEKIVELQTEPIEVEEETEETEEESEEEEKIITNVPLTLGDIYTQTRGPPLVPTDYKVSETTYPPTMQKVTTEEYVSSEIDLETTEISEVATAETGI